MAPRFAPAIVTVDPGAPDEGLSVVSRGVDRVTLVPESPDEGGGDEMLG
jgi:hypothetical protein